MKCASFSASVPEFVALLGVTLLERSKQPVICACSHVRLQIDVFLPLFMCKLELGCSKGTLLPSWLLLGLWETQERRNSSAHLSIKPLFFALQISDFPPYLMSTRWRWWQPHLAELPDSWGAWKDGHTSSLLLYPLYWERTSTKEEDGGDHHLMRKHTLRHKHRSF